MKAAAEVLAQTGVIPSRADAVNLSPPGPSESTAITTSARLEKPRLEGSHLRRIWERMTAIYAAKWTSAMGITPHDEHGALTVGADTWERALRDFTGIQIAAGLSACLNRGDSWPPSLPEFRLMCLQVPTLPQVRRELREDQIENYSAFALMVYRRLDPFLYRRADVKHAEAMLREAYEEATTALLRGEKLPELGGLLENRPDPPRPASPETVERCLREIRANLAGLDHDGSVPQGEGENLSETTR